MSIQYVYIGTNPNDGTGDDLRTAFLKVNDNFQLLATIGGETNIGANLGGAGGEVYAGKTNETLNFRTIAEGDGIGINQSGNVITIRNTATTPPTLTKVFDDSGNYYEAQAPGGNIKILGSGAVSTQLTGNELIITGIFALFDDTTPTLGANLNLNGFDITGTGDLSHVGTILTDGLTVGRSSGPGDFPSITLLNGSLTVKSNTVLASVSATTVAASTSVQAPIFNATGNGFYGTLTGPSNGTHYGNLAIKGDGVPDIIVVNTASDPATITGVHVGSFSGSITGSLQSGGLDLNSNNIFGVGTISITGSQLVGNVPLVANAKYHPPALAFNQVPTISNSSGATLLTMELQTSSLTDTLRLRSVSADSDQLAPNGSVISFESVNTNSNPLTPGDQPEYILHGKAGIVTYDEYGIFSGANPSPTNHSTFVVQVRATEVPGTPYLRDVIVARGNGNLTLGLIDLIDSKIYPSKQYNNTLDIVEDGFNDLILTTNRSTTYVNFYGDYDPLLGAGSAQGGYSLPKAIGTPGQVLAVRTPDGINPNNLLEWVTATGGGGGGGSTTLLALTDFPDTYPVDSGGKVVVVKSNLTGVEFTNSITASLIGNVTGSVTGNASTATALQTTRTINGKNFNGTQNVSLTTADINEVTNLYFTDERARTAISVIGGTSLSYNSLTGVFNIQESSINVINTLVKRNGTGGVELGLVKVTTLEKNTTDTAITINSRVETDSVIASTADISTTDTLSAGYINLTGTGDQTIASSAKIILSPGTSIDVSGKKIINLPVAAPTLDTDAASKKYVDDTANAVYDASLQSFPITGDTGGSLSVIKNTTLIISGSSNINTSTTINGVQVSLKSTISGVSVSGNFPVSGTLTANVVKAGNLNITNNEIQQTVTGNNLNIVPGSSGGSVIVTGGDFKLTTNSRLFVTGTNIVEIAANSLELEITTTTPTTFVRTLNWVDDSAGLAYAFMNDGTQGQHKTIIMLDRGNYGNALDTRPRYLVLRGKFNGASRTINIAASDPNGSSTFIFLDGFWWRTANVA